MARFELQPLQAAPRAGNRLFKPIALGAVLIAAFVFGMGIDTAFRPPWTLTGWMLHMVAAPSCDLARAVGVAPARHGTPGYWPWHDSRNQGVACEAASSR